jgi:hypothetical protein
MDTIQGVAYRRVIDEICSLKWGDLTSDDMVSVAWGYYYFSIQFGENLKIARELHPNDAKLQKLEQEECNTSNLSPWPAVAKLGERMNHDEFMRRTLELSPVSVEQSLRLQAIGAAYLATTRAADRVNCALSIASYEDGGLENVFKAMLSFRHWDNDSLRAFRHFLSEHVRFDSDPSQGHGALIRHMFPDDRILGLWEAFRDVLVKSAPHLSGMVHDGDKVPFV